MFRKEIPWATYLASFTLVAVIINMAFCTDIAGNESVRWDGDVQASYPSQCSFTRAVGGMEITEVPESAVGDFLMDFRSNGSMDDILSLRVMVSKDGGKWDHLPVNTYEILDNDTIMVHGSLLEAGSLFFGITTGNGTSPEASWPRPVVIEAAVTVDTSTSLAGFDPDTIYYVFICIFIVLVGGVALYVKGHTDQIKSVMVELEEKEPKENREGRGNESTHSIEEPDRRKRGRRRGSVRARDGRRRSGSRANDDVSWGEDDVEVGWERNEGSRRPPPIRRRGMDGDTEWDRDERTPGRSRRASFGKTDSEYRTEWEDQEEITGGRGRPGARERPRGGRPIDPRDRRAQGGNRRGRPGRTDKSYSRRREGREHYRKEDSRQRQRKRSGGGGSKYNNGSDEWEVEYERPRRYMERDESDWL